MRLNPTTCTNFESKKMTIDVRINDNQLPEEWLGQPTMMQEASTAVAEAQLVFDNSKARLAVVAADLLLEVRNNPAEYNIDKITETTVAAAITIDDDHKTATTKVNQTRYALGIAKAAEVACEHRKRALTCLVELLGKAYYAEPRAPKTDDTKRTVRRRGRNRAGGGDG